MSFNTVCGEELVSNGSTPIYSRRAVIDSEVWRGIQFPWDARCFQCLVQLLASAGALETSELGMMLHIEVQISDQRSARSVSLPQYPAVEFGLQ